MTTLSLIDRIKLSADQAPLIGRSYFSFVRAVAMLRSLAPNLARCLLQRRMPTPVELRQGFEAMGVTYIKLGQFIGSSPSLFPAEYVEAFQDCFDRTPAHDFSLICKVIERELERPLDSVFSDIDEEPMAIASIAQVHTAKLITGEPVVIKVQKPGVEATIDVDLNIMLLMTRLVERLTPNLNRQMISGFIEAIFPYMKDECNFCKEEQYLIDFGQFIKEQGIKEVVVPKPYPAFSSKRVLVMERLYGGTFSDKLRKSPRFTKTLSQPFTAQNDSAEFKAAQNLSQAVSKVKKVWLASLFQHWFFHADLHLGNMMLLDDGNVGLIDFGLVGSISPKIWKSCQKLFIGVLQDNSRDVAEALFGIGMTSDTIDIESFSKDIEKLMKQTKDLDTRQNYNEEASDVLIDEQLLMQDANRWLIELGKLSRNYGLIFPHAFTLLLKQFLYFDRLESYSSGPDSMTELMETIFEDMDLALDEFDRQ